MAAERLPLLSEEVSDLARRAGLGDRFLYWRGHSGRRYLFTAIACESLADFRSAVVILAEFRPDGRFVGRTVTALDSAGRGWPPIVPAGQAAFVHLLATTAEDRRAVLRDLGSTTLSLAA